MNAVITGASRGIGKALAQIFALHGYNLFLCSKTESHLLQAMEELHTAFPNVTIQGQAMDLGQKAEAITAYEKSKELAADPNLTRYVDSKIQELKK